MSTEVTEGGEVLVTETRVSPEVESLYAHCDALLSAAEEDLPSRADDFRGLVSILHTGAKEAKQLAAKNIPRFIAHFQDQVGPALNAVESVIDSGDEQLHDLGLSILAATASKVTRGADKVATCCCRLMLRELPEKDAALVRKALDAAVAAGPSDALSAVLEHCAVDPAGNEACLKIASRALSPRRVTRMRKEGTLAGVAASVLSLLRAPDLPTASFVPLFGAMSRVANSPGGGAPAPAKVAENGAAAGTADEPDVAAAPPAVSAADLVSLLTARVRPDAPFDPASEEDADRAVLAARLGVPLVRHHPEAAQPFAAFVLDKALPSAASLPTKAQEAVMRSLVSLARDKNKDATRRAILRGTEGIIRAAFPPSEDALVAAAKSSEGKPILAFELLENALFCLHAQAAKNPYDLPIVLGIRGARFTGQPTDIIPDEKEETAKTLKEGLGLVVKACQLDSANVRRALKGQKGAASTMLKLALHCMDNVKRMAAGLRQDVATLLAENRAPVLSWTNEARTLVNKPPQQQQQQKQGQQQKGQKQKQGQQQQQGQGKARRGGNRKRPTSGNGQQQQKQGQQQGQQQKQGQGKRRRRR